jgi:hypothetical protein
MTDGQLEVILPLRKAYFSSRHDLISAAFMEIFASADEGRREVDRRSIEHIEQA